MISNDIKTLLREQNAQSVKITVFDKTQLISDIEKYIKVLQNKNLIKPNNHYNQYIKLAERFIKDIRELQTVDKKYSKDFRAEIVKMKNKINFSDEKNKAQLINSLDKIISLVKVEYYINQYYCTQFSLAINEASNIAFLIECYNLKMQFKLFLNTVQSYNLFIKDAFQRGYGYRILIKPDKDYFTEISVPKGTYELGLKKELNKIIENLELNTSADKYDIEKFNNSLKQLYNFDQKMFQQSNYINIDYLIKIHLKIVSTINILLDFINKYNEEGE